MIRMKILILGGTKFVGFHTAVEAVAHGHEVTLFHRGTHKAPAGTKTIIGDRLVPESYSPLKDLSFDVVIDTWSTDPLAVKHAVDALRGRIKQYIYISTGSVYDFSKGTRPYKESTPLFDPKETDVPYIQNKVQGERYADETGVATFLRPGVILGPLENVWRLPWWLKRMEKGGKTLAPGPKDLGLQFIDARDLAEFTVLVAEQGLQGAYNMVAEPNHMSMGDFLDTANEVAGEKAQLCWLTPAQLKEAEIQAWGEMPMWLEPEPNESVSHDVYNIDVSKAKAAGMTIRSPRGTIADTWKWLASEADLPVNDKIGLDPKKEESALSKYCP